MGHNKIVTTTRYYRQKLLDDINIDIFELAGFLERYLARLLGGNLTAHSAHTDIILSDRYSTRVEIKHSNVVFDITDKNPRAYFSWHRLRGYNNKKDANIDFVVLTGYTGYRDSSVHEIVMPEDKKGMLWIWVFSYEDMMEKIGKSGRIEYKISLRGNRGFAREAWVKDFFIGHDEEKLIEYFRQNKPKR